jgi:hypothetical protein
VGVGRSSLARTTVSYEVSHFSAVEAGSYGFGESRRSSICIGLVDSWESSVVRCSSPRQVHRYLDVIVGGSWGVCRVICLLPRRLLRVARALAPVALLCATPELLEGVLRAVIWDSSSSPYRFDHLSGLGMLNGFGFVLLIGFWERRGNDRVKDARREAVQEEADSFFASDGVSCAADEFFKICDVLIYFREAHLASVQVESCSLLFL